MSETTEQPKEKPYMKKNDWERMLLNGKVKQVMQVVYNAAYRDAKLVKENIDAARFTLGGNFIFTFNEIGYKISEEDYSKDEIETKAFNEFQHNPEIIKKDFSGNVKNRVVHTFTPQNTVLDTFSYNGDGTLYYKVLQQCNEHGLPLERIHYQADEKTIVSRETHEYNENGRPTITIYYDNTGAVRSTHTNTYDERGNVIESRTQYPDKKMKNEFGWHKQRYNEQGDCVELTYLNEDGTVHKSHTYTYEYDKDGKKIVPYHPPFDPYAPREEGEVIQKEEKDEKGNWIKRIIYKNKFPQNIVVRQIIYYGENEDIELVHPILKEEPGELKESWDFTEELTEAEAMWLTEEPGRNADNFALLRYYAQTYRMAPTVTTYTGPYIDALAVLKLLTETDKVQQIHTVSRMDSDGKEVLEKYTIKFPHYYGHILQASQIINQSANQFDLKSKENINIENGYVHFSQFILLRPGKMDERDENSWFQEHLDRVFYKCTLKKLPNKPVIRMIEVEGGGFVMREHPVDDDFEIKDLDINYGYGFSEFNDELMQRLQQGTKGLILFHGQPGTGKTYYIRHLLRQMVVNRKVVIYMPPNMVDHLAEPGFMTFLMSNVRHYSNQGFFCVLLIEDAEPLLAKRQEGVRIQGVTNLLNMTDGLLNDMLNIQIMCTFNVDLKKLDSALLRPGRLIARKEFKQLSELDANLLAQRLGIKHHFNEPASLGEIYAMKKNNSILIHDVKSEEGASTGADDF